MLLPFLTIALIHLTSSEELYRIVDTKFGKIRGKEIASESGQYGFVFAGIPMAKPPLRTLRFKEAANPEKWEGVLDTFSYKNACLSDPIKTYKTYAGPVSEDCLYINVFTSRTCIDFGGCSVLAYIHGGARNFESPVVFPPDIIVNNFANQERNVIVVTIPYRTGAMGWFNPAPGLKTSAHSNVALRDCYFGLEWIQSEIEAFGGDTKRVTLMAHSAGGSQIQEMVVSPRSVGLYNKFISMSGLGYGGDRSPSVNSKFSQKLARKLKCATEKDKFDKPQRVEQILACLRRLPSEDILEAQLSFMNDVEEAYGTWIDGPGGVLPNYIRELLKDPPKLGCLVGTVSAELRDTRYLVKDGKVDMELLDWICTHTAYERNYERPEQFRKVCLEHYGQVNNTPFFNDDLLFYNHNAGIASGFSKKSNCYVYSFEYDEIGPAYRKFVTQEISPGHAEDFIYIFGLARDLEKFTEKDRRIEQIYTGILANFVNSGDPTYLEQKWEPWSEERRNYFKIDFDENLTMPGQTDGYYTKAYEFWEKTATMAAGDWSPLTFFPPQADVYIEKAIVDAKMSIIKNASRFIDKLYPAVVETLDMWERHLPLLQQRKKMLAWRAGNSTTNLVETTDGGINWLTLSLAVSLVILVVYIGYMKYNDWRKRKDYELITQ